MGYKFYLHCICMNRNSLNNPAQFINIMTPLSWIINIKTPHSWIFVPGFSDEEVKKCWHFTLGKFKVPFINLNTLTTKRYQPSVKRLASWESRTDTFIYSHSFSTIIKLYGIYACVLFNLEQFVSENYLPKDLCKK